MSSVRCVVGVCCVGVLLSGMSPAFGQNIRTGRSGSLPPKWGRKRYSCSRNRTRLTAALGQQVIVENRSGVIAIETVAKAVRDGYTLLHWQRNVRLHRCLRDKVSYFHTTR